MPLPSGPLAELAVESSAWVGAPPVREIWYRGDLKGAHSMRTMARSAVSWAGRSNLPPHIGHGCDTSDMRVQRRCQIEQRCYRQSRHPRFLSRGVDGVDAGLFHSVKGPKASVPASLISLFSVSAASRTLCDTAPARLFKSPLNVIAVLAHPFIFEVGCPECTGNRGSHGKAYGAKHKRLSFE